MMWHANIKSGPLNLDMVWSRTINLAGVSSSSRNILPLHDQNNFFGRKAPKSLERFSMIFLIWGEFKIQNGIVSCTRPETKIHMILSCEFYHASRHPLASILCSHREECRQRRSANHPLTGNHFLSSSMSPPSSNTSPSLDDGKRIKSDFETTMIAQPSLGIQITLTPLAKFKDLDSLSACHVSTRSEQSGFVTRWYTSQV